MNSYLLNLSFNAFNNQLELPHIFQTSLLTDYNRIYEISDEFEIDFIVKGNGMEYQRIEEIKKVQSGSEATRLFNDLLFTKIMPNLKKIGLLTDEVSEKYEKMGILKFKDLEDAGAIDWKEMSKPLEYSSKTA